MCSKKNMDKYLHLFWKLNRAISQKNINLLSHFTKICVLPLWAVNSIEPFLKKICNASLGS